MQIEIFPDQPALGARAASLAAETLRQASAERGEAFLLVATGASQFETLAHLVRADGVDWSKVTAFHLDEYVGLPADHPAGFRRYLKERFVEKLPDLRAFHYVDGDADDPQAECARLGALLPPRPLDVGCIGIGENGHIAFNDPPADFETEEPFLVVELDEACRRQQHGEGWFATLDDVPTTAITMSVRQILKARRLVVSVPDERKAEAVKNTATAPVSPEVPASILRTHGECWLLLDEPAASKLPPALRNGAVT